MTVVFAHVAPDEVERAWNWHRAFAADNPGIFLRSKEFFDDLVEKASLLAARENGIFVGMCYYTLDEEAGEWEVGGLMVDTDWQRQGVGRILAYLTLGSLLIDEDPIPAGQAILTRVHCDNRRPRALIEGGLRFTKTDTIEVPGSEWPGAKCDSLGNVHVDVFALTRPETVEALADWCAAWGDNWSGRAPDGSDIYIDMRDTPDIWTRAFRDMA